MHDPVYITPTPIPSRPPLGSREWFDEAWAAAFDVILETAFCKALAEHADDELDFVYVHFRNLAPEWRALVVTPGGWTSLARILCVPGAQPLYPTIH